MINYRYKEEDDMEELATSLSAKMLLQRGISTGHLLDDITPSTWEPELIHTTLNHFRPELLRVDVLSEESLSGYDLLKRNMDPITEISYYATT